MCNVKWSFTLCLLLVWRSWNSKTLWYWNLKLCLKKKWTACERSWPTWVLTTLITRLHLLIIISFIGDLQSENAVLKVRLNNLEQEAQDETQRMQDLLQENAQLELLKERKWVHNMDMCVCCVYYSTSGWFSANDIENLKRELDKLRMAATTGNSSDGNTSVHYCILASFTIICISI